MADSLTESFRVDLGCDAGTAARLAALARSRVLGIGGTDEDTDEDLVQRLRDPRIFGEFVVPLLADREIADGLQAVLAERVFDLLPLPRSEGDVILVEVRAPRQLLSIARHLSDAGGLTVLHVMHLVYAIFLDRGIVASATHDERSAVLRAVLDQTGASSALRALYAAMHLAAVPEPEAYREFRAILRREGDHGMKADLARATIAGDGGTSDLLRIARDEQLVAADWTDPSSPEVVANIPRLPPRLRALGRRWLAKTA